MGKGVVNDPFYRDWLFKKNKNASFYFYIGSEKKMEIKRANK